MGRLDLDSSEQRKLTQARLASKAAARADQGFLTRIGKSVLHAFGRSTTQNMLKRQRSIVAHGASPDADWREHQRVQMAEEHLRFWEKSLENAKILGEQGGTAYTQRADNYHNLASGARGVQSAAEFSEGAAAVAATTGILAPEAAAVAAVAEPTKQLARAAAGAAEGRVVASLDTATSRENSAAQHTTGDTRAYHEAQKKVISDSRMESFQRTDGATPQERSALRSQKLSDMDARGEVLAKITNQEMTASGMHLIGRQAADLARRRTQVRESEAKRLALEAQKAEREKLARKEEAVNAATRGISAQSQRVRGRLVAAQAASFAVERTSKREAQAAALERAATKERAMGAAQRGLAAQKQRVEGRMVAEQAASFAAERNAQHDAQTLLHDYRSATGPQTFVSRLKQRLTGHKTTAVKIEEALHRAGEAQDSDTRLTALHEAARHAEHWQSKRGSVGRSIRGRRSQAISRLTTSIKDL